ncbi:hypothetical protein [Streptomyces sp. KR80]|uniref:hypothetical protein n=1 Tax=Streptomyces sp. KR80 TaxID=3457426 RepID=UPI003FCF3EF9
MARTVRLLVRHRSGRSDMMSRGRRRSPGRMRRPRTPKPHQVASRAARGFDALYTEHAAGLVRQTRLLTGRQRLAYRAVERAFHRAWQRWPRVAVARDPAGWVRAAAYEYALAPWHRLLPARQRPLADAGPHPALAAAFVALPPSYRRALLLHDGLGLGIAETAAECEASAMATVGRVTHARACVAELLPELRGVSPSQQDEALRRMLGELIAAQPVRTRPADAVRLGSERRTRWWTRGALGLTALIAVVTAFVAAVRPDGYRAPQAPGESVATASPVTQMEEGRESRKPDRREPGHEDRVDARSGQGPAQRKAGRPVPRQGSLLPETR